MEPPLSLAASLCPGCDIHHPHRPGGKWQLRARLQPLAHVSSEGPAELPTCSGALSLPSCREGGRGQMTTSPRSSCSQLLPPTVTFTSTQSATAPSPIYCRDSHADWPVPHLLWAGFSPKLPLPLPSIPHNHLKLNGMFLRLQRGQVGAGWTRWGQEAKAGQCEASSSIPLGTQVPCHPSLGPSDQVLGQAAPMLLRELPLTLLEHMRE